MKPDEAAMVEAVRRNARLSIRDLAAKCDLAETTARDILRRLESRGVIKGYRPVLDEDELGVRGRSLLIVRGSSEALEQVRGDKNVVRCMAMPDRPDGMAVWVAAEDATRLAIAVARVGLHAHIEEEVGLAALPRPVGLREGPPLDLLRGPPE